MNSSAIYQEDLAYVHHTGFGDSARTAAPELLRLMRNAGNRGGVLVDLGCGSGLWANIAQRDGFNVIGVDRSEAMIQLAKQEAPSALFHWASLYGFELEVGLAYGWYDDLKPAAVCNGA